MKSLYGRYLEEREGKEIIEDENGFASYYIEPGGEECYISDIYVVPEKRRAGIARAYADRITEIAEALGCSYLTASADPEANGVADAINVFLRYGMSFYSVGKNGLIHFKKDL